ncbi:MAG: hypothetical protein OEW12_00105 [Deltaproteobacteria bacterium]|nr:hypothetical protein [Deltaproteobacteria bacterium]
MGRPLLPRPLPTPPPFSAPPASIQNIKQGAFRYTLPVDGIPMASGRGCALTKPEAETQAQHAAAYNLRSLLGQGKYQVGYRGLVLVADPYGRVCYEVEAYQTKR